MTIIAKANVTTEQPDAKECRRMVAGAMIDVLDPENGGGACVEGRYIRGKNEQEKRKTLMAAARYRGFLPLIIYVPEEDDTYHIKVISWIKRK